MTAKVYKYGSKSAQVEWSRDHSDNLYLMNQLWNRLVEIHHQNRRNYWALLKSHTVLAPTISEITEREGIIAAAYSAIRAKKQEARSAQVEESEERHVIQTQREKLAPLYATRKKLVARVKGELAEEIKEIQADHKAKVKRARQESGLYWSNYNAVIDSYTKARSKALATGAELRFKPFDDTGRFVIQIMGGLTGDQIMSGKTNQVKIVDTQDHKNGQLVTFDFIVRTKPEKLVLTIPVVMHRPLPKDGLIKSIQINRRRRGIRYIYNVMFTHVDECEITPRDGQSIAINLGYKNVVGGIRVATALKQDGAFEHLVLPQSIKENFDKLEKLSSDIDVLTNDFKLTIRESVVPYNGEPVEPEERAIKALSNFLRSQSFSLPKLLWALAVARTNKDHALFGWADWSIIEEFMTNVSVLNQHKARLRERTLRHRREIYRVWCKELLVDVGRVVIDDTDYAEIQSDPDNPTPVKRQKSIVAPFEFKLALELMADKEGITIIKDDGKISVCPSCGGTLNRKQGDALAECGSCHSQTDVDIAACVSMITNLGLNKDVA